MTALARDDVLGMQTGDRGYTQSMNAAGWTISVISIVMIFVIAWSWGRNHRS